MTIHQNIRGLPCVSHRAIMRRSVELAKELKILPAEASLILRGAHKRLGTKVIKHDEGPVTIQMAS